MNRAAAIRDGIEQAHPALKRRRLGFEEMALKVHAFMDIPERLPVRKYSERELAQMRYQRQVANLADHVWYRGKIVDLQSQPPVPIAYVDCNTLEPI